jgi:16S rRNA (cytosine1402-N4)-methyltransferase
MMTQYHEPALVEEVLHYLISQPDGVYVDGTVGGGGHAEAILTLISSRGKLVGMDLDCEAITFARRRLERFGEKISRKTARNQVR